MDLAALTDDDLDALRVAVLTEQERRRTLADVPAQAAALADRYSAAIGRKDGDPWAQPTGAHDAYPLAATVTHDGKTWESLIPFNVWAPGVSGWREVVAEGYPAWVQPTGAHDAYAVGAQVTHAGRRWLNAHAANTYTPGVYGWTDVGPA